MIYTENSNSEIVFSDSKVVTFGGNASTSFHGNGTVSLNGTISSTNGNGILLGDNAKVNFGSATSDISGFSGSITLANSSEITFNAGSLTKVISDKLQCNGTGSIVNLDAVDVLRPNEIRVSKSNQANRGVTFNVNANQNLRTIKLEGLNSFFNLNIDDSVTSVVFYANNSGWSETSQFNISGFKDGILKFGSNDSSLNGGGYLENIHIVDGVNAGKDVVLDTDGTLYLAETLSSSRTSILDYSVYPNPAKDIIHIQTSEKIEVVTLYDIVGNKISEVAGTQIDVSTVVPGVYVVKIKTINNKYATQKFIVQ